MSPDLCAINVDQHSVKMAFDHLNLKIGHRFTGIGELSGGCILKHKHSVFVINICDGKGLWT